MLRVKEIKSYIKIMRSGLFDSDYYLQTYPDIRDAGVNPLIHFIKHGWREGKNPSQNFDTLYYLINNPDVKVQGINPLIHYLNSGWNEGRNPSNHFNSRWYLEKYSDVKKAGVNPLVHYLKFGKAEGRLPQAMTENPFEISINTSSNFLEEILLPAELAQRIQKSVNSGKTIISISSDDYLLTKGGIQIYISHEQQTYNQNEIDYLHVYPKTGNKTLMDEDFSITLGVNLNGKYLGASSSSSLIASIQKTNLNVADVRIHHTTGLNISTINELLALNNNKGKFWLHDYYSLCPSYNLLRNDLEYCGAPNIYSNACTICKFGDLRIKQQARFMSLFNENKLSVIAPSQYALDFWLSKSQYAITMGETFPIAKLNWTGWSEVQHASDQIRIGYLGYPFRSKGWETWIRLVSAFGNDQFKFFHFSSQDGTVGNYERVNTAVTPENPTIMIDSLVKNRIDAVVLWSIWPETFSITLHEALAAGCFVITNKWSGNIQDYLRKNPSQGIVLENEQELVDFLQSGELRKRIQEFHKNGKPISEIVWMGGGV